MASLVFFHLPHTLQFPGPHPRRAWHPVRENKMISLPCERKLLLIIPQPTTTRVLLVAHHPQDVPQIFLHHIKSAKIKCLSLLLCFDRNPCVHTHQVELLSHRHRRHMQNRTFSKTTKMDPEGWKGITRTQIEGEAIYRDLYRSMYYIPK